MADRGAGAGSAGGRLRLLRTSYAAACAPAPTWVAHADLQMGHRGSSSTDTRPVASTLTQRLHSKTSRHLIRLPFNRKRFSRSLIGKTRLQSFASFGMTRSP